MNGTGARLLLGLLTGLAVTRAEPPVITEIRPIALAIGQVTELTMRGRHLKEAHRLWLDRPAKAELVRAGNESSVWRIAVPTDSPCGIAALRVVTSEGISGLELLWLDDLPTVSGASRHSLEEPRKLELPVAVDGTVTALRSDFFVFRGRRGERISLETVAHRIGSALDPVLRLLDADGEELAYSDDFAGAGSDSGISSVIPRDGEYSIELRDLAYGGGSSHRYRLRCGNFPLVQQVCPAGLRRGDVAVLDPVTEHCLGPAIVAAPSDWLWQTLPVALRSLSSGDGYAEVAVSDVPEVLEAEPNDERGGAAVSWPVVLNGRFQKAGDLDLFAIDVPEPAALRIEGRTRSLGSPCDLLIRLLSDQGSVLASSDAQRGDEGVIDHMFKEGGRYWIEVRELNGGGGANLVYRARVDRAPRFSLSIETETLNGRAGDEMKIPVKAVRHGFKGPISLRAEIAASSGGEGTKTGESSSSSGRIAEGKEEGELTFRLPSAEPGQIQHIRIVGVAEVDGGIVEAAASTLPALRQKFGRMLYPPVRWDGWIAVGISPRPGASE